MTVWLSVIAFSLIVSSIGMASYSKKSSTISINNTDNENLRTISFFFALLSFALLIFFVGQRSWIFDTTTYTFLFESMLSSDLSQIKDVLSQDLPQYKGKGYCIAVILFKHYISTDCNAWFTLVAFIQCAAIASFYSKYSSNFLYSIFLFYFTSCFLWTVNGMRQFLATSIILMFSHFLLERKTVPFILVVLLAATFHTSAIIMLPVYFCVNGAPWRKKTLFLLTIVYIILIVYVFVYSSDNSEYSYITSDIYSGVNIFRVIVMSIPTIFAFIKRKSIAEKGISQINILINLSILCSACFVLGAFTNGMVARIALYFQVYTYVLLPWIFKNEFSDNSKHIKIAVTILLIAYFCYDMYLAGNGIYQSDNLKIY